MCRTVSRYHVNSPFRVAPAESQNYSLQSPHERSHRLGSRTLQIHGQAQVFRVDKMPVVHE